MRTLPLLAMSLLGALPAFAQDLVVTKTFVGPVVAGANVTWTITINNVGIHTAANILMNDVLGSTLTFVSLSAPGGAFCATPTVGNSGNIVCTLPIMGPGGSATFTLVAFLNAFATGTLSNTVTASGETADPTPANNTSTASSPIVPVSADLSVVKTSSATVAAGANVTYTTVIANNGPSAAASVSVTGSTPSGTTFVSNSGACATAFPCSLGTLASGASATITSVYSVGAGLSGGTALASTATVSSGNVDPNSANNTSTATPTVTVSSDVTAVMSGPVSVTNGNITYSISVNNTGPSTATAVTVTDVLPAGVALVSATPSQGSCSGTATVTCALGTLAPGSATVSLVVSVNAGFSGTVANTATVSAAGSDPVPGNNTSTVSTVVAPATIPVVSPWTLALLTGALGVAALRLMRATSPA